MKSFRRYWKAVLACALWLNTALPLYAEEPDTAEPAPAAETETPVPEEEPQETEELTEEPVQTAEPQETTVPEKPEELPAEAGPEETPSAEEETAAAQEATAYSDRLIVFGGEIRETDHVISSYEEMTLLGFMTPEALQEGFAYYQAHSAHTEIDGVILAADEEGITDAPNEISEENNPIDQLQELLCEEADLPKNRAVRIALIDTGAKEGCGNITSAVSVLGDNPADDNGHGSRMADCILAQNPDAEILSIKALDANGKGTMSSVYAAMEYAMEQEADLIALCMSACVSAENRIIADEIEKAAGRGIRTVGAAGNSGLNVKYFIPAGNETAVIAGSCDEAGVIRDFSNYGDTVDYLVISDSTSEAAAVLCGILSKNTGDPSDDPRVFAFASAQSDEKPDEPGTDDAFYSQCNSFFYGDAYYWEVPYGETTTANAVLIPGYQQEILNAKTDSANGYSVQFQSVADESFSRGHGYAVFASTHKASAVSSWGSNVHVTDFRGSYEAWGREFNSMKTFSIGAKTIPDFRYLGVIVSQNKTAKPGAAQVSALSKAGSASVKLGEADATYWNDVPGVNTVYWEGWSHTTGGTEYPSFRVDFYYMSDKPHHSLTINYLEEGTDEPVAPAYGPKQVMETAEYAVPSADPEDFELINPEEAVISGIMPDHDVVIDVYYRRVYKILTSVINGTITLNNEMEENGTTGDETWNASGKVTKIHSGEDRTIRWACRPDFMLDYVKTDDEFEDTQQYPDSYEFKNVTEDHKIEVRCVESPVPDDSKQVKNAQGTVIDGAMVNAGDVLTYTVRVKNVFTGERETEIRDRIPQYTAYVDDSADNDGTFEAGTLKWNLTLQEGEEKTVSFQVIVLDDAKDTVITNQAEVSINHLELVTNETENPVLPDPVKRVENPDGEDCDQQVVPVDRNVIYYITVKNPGHSEKEFTITDAVDEGQTADPSSISDQGSLNGRIITWKIRVPAGETRTVSFAAMPKDLELTIPNKAEVKADDARTETNETVIFTPCKAIKTVTDMSGNDLDGKAIALNEEFLYRIAVTNPSYLRKEYRVTDIVPSEVQVIAAGTYGETFERGDGNASVSDREVTWTKELDGEETVIFCIMCRLKETDAVFTNKARVITGQIESETNEVSNWSGQIIINAEIEEYWEPYGQPSFLYDISDGNGTMWHRLIIIDSASRRGQTVFNIPSGHDPDTWTIRDEAGSRYTFRRASPGSSNVTVSGNTASALITEENRIGIADYFYGIERWDETSHLDAVINRIEYRRSAA